MEEQHSPILFSRNEEIQSVTGGRALWQPVRKPHRGRGVLQPANEFGPYETSYTISAGYPDREIGLP